MLPEQALTELTREIEELKTQLAYETQLRQRLEADNAQLVRFLKSRKGTASGGCFLVLILFTAFVAYFLILTMFQN